MVRNVFFIVTILCSAASARAGSNWAEFRGSNGDGHADEARLPEKFSETENVVWKTPIHDLGWSSPVVWGDQVWLTTATEDGHQLFAICVDRNTGSIVHDRKLFDIAEPKFRHATNTYASPTPAIEDGRVYVHFGAYGTACLDTQTGETIWERRDFVSDDFRGPGSSPVIHENLLFINFDGVDFQFVVALDKATGETVWKKDRNIDYGTDDGDFKKAYCTPLVINAGGRHELVSPAAVETIAYDPPTGNELWRVKHGGMNAAARPQFAHGLIYVAAGDGGMALVAIRPGGDGDVTDERVAWKQSKTVPKRSTPLVVGKHLFMVNDGGVASCLDAGTGDFLWSHRLEGEYWASPVYADGKIFFFSQQGAMPVIEAAPKFKLLAENHLDAGCNASPAVAGNSLFVRTKTHLYRIEAR